MSNLLAHKDTHRATEAAVKAVLSPEFTDTWHPVSHADVIDSLEIAVRDRGFRVVNKEYSMNDAGTKMFGAWDLSLGDRSTGYALGIRNSLDKSMVLGVCAGTRVFVCDNMCFSGDFITFRKHTGGLDLDELGQIGYNAIGGAVIEMERMVDWQNGMHDYYVPAPQRKEMVYDMMDQGVFSPSQFNKFQDCLEAEKAIDRGRKLDGCNTLYNIHGGATRLMRDWSLLRVADATRKLNKICNDYMNTRDIN